jgi:hypothetical protein
LLLASCRLDEPRGTTIHVPLVDEQGAPVTEAQGLVRRIDPPTPCGDWIPLKGGVLALAHAERWEPPEAYEVLVRARGFTLWRGSLADFERQKEALVLLPARTFELELSTADGRPVPESLMPIVFDPEFAPTVWLKRAWDGPPVSCLPVERSGAQSFLVSAPANPAQLFVLIDEPGFLRAFQAGPITDTMIATGSLAVPLPAPASVKCRIERPPEQRGDLFVEIHRALDAAGRTVAVPVQRRAVGTSSVVRVDDLAPGSYTFSLVVGEGSPPRKGGPDSPDRKRIDVLSAAAYEMVLSAP